MMQKGICAANGACFLIWNDEYRATSQDDDDERRMGYKQPASSGKAVNVLSFCQSLSRVWRPTFGEERPSSLKFGIAVSGGPDSIALAILCAQAKERSNSFRRQVSLAAFIVDHGTRPGSAQEAIEVKGWLEGHLGIETKVLSLKWPSSGLVPSRLANFETIARQLRYRALGKACHNAGIPSLLLGHHEDDQRETILLRLIEGFTGDGLRGISESANIPECQGIYGASHSGRNSTSKSRLVLKPKKDCKSRFTFSGECHEEGFESGGVQVLRPLLHYRKKDLEATCRVNGIPWKTDATNQDPTLTTRNAIRHLMQRGLLPEALCKLDTMNYPLGNLATSARQKAIKSEAKAEIAFQACKIISFDARSGQLLIRLPLCGFEAGDKYSSCGQSKPAIEIEYIRARLLRKILSIVSPQDSISLQTLEFATKVIFLDPKDLDHDLDLNARKSGPWNFSTCGATLQRIDSCLTNPPLNPSPGMTLDPHFIWLFSRQPYDNNLPVPECTFPPSPPFEQKPAHDTHNPTLDHGPNNWQLYDGRYWIRLHNPTTEPLFIRPLTKSTLHHLRTTLKLRGQDSALRRLQADLAAAAPEKARFTLPAIVDGEGTVLALPTLGFAVPGAGMGGLRWQVRYKEVVLPKGIERERVIPPGGIDIRDGLSSSSGGRS